MNVDLNQLQDSGHNEDCPADCDTLHDTLTNLLDAHLSMLATSPGMAGTAFTGRQALTPETDLPYTYRVWSETVLGTWVWVDPDGVCIELAAPLVLLAVHNG